MNKALRENVQTIANDALETIKDAMMGKASMTDRVREVIRVVTLGIKAGHLDQLAEQSNRSFAIRLLPHLSKEVDREEYIRQTNPQIVPALLSRPKELGRKN
jgi:hypothetical protein